MTSKTRPRPVISVLIRKLKRNHSLLLTLSAAVVFVTTYMLILPALTLDQDTAGKQGGIDVPKAEQQLSDNGNLTYEGEGFTIDAAYDTKAGLPLDVALTAEEIQPDTKDYKALQEEALAAVQEESDSVESLEFAQFYDISLIDGETPVEPEQSVDVSISFDKALKAADAEHVRIVHFGEKKTEVLDPEDVKLELKKGKLQGAEFKAESFSVYGVVYTVDFEYEGEEESGDSGTDDKPEKKTYKFSIEGESSIKLSELFKELHVKADAAEAEKVTFTDADLIEVTQIDGDWELKSLKAFDSEEKLTVSMKNGDLFTIKVTDYQTISETAQFNSNDSFVIAYEDTQGKYHVLKTDGTQEIIDSKDDIDYLDNNYKWKFYYVFEEKDHNAPNAKTKYYFIRPISDLSKSIALNDVGEDLVQNGTNNIGIIPQEGGFYLEGYASNNEDVPTLFFDENGFKARMYEKSLIQIYKQEDIKKYEFTVRTADPGMGLVSGKDKTGTQKNNVEEFVTRTKDNNNNNWGAEAKAKEELKNGKNRYLFDYFDLNGERVPDDMVDITNSGRNGKIKADKLQIPYNGSVLTAHFKLNPEYVGPSSVEDLENWVEGLKNKNIPLDESATKKTAEVYDYENRIYRVDLSTKSSLTSFNGTVDLGLILDVSGSMKFPSKLVPAEEVSGEKNIWKINNETSSGSGRYNWQDWGMDRNKTYYVIAEKTTRATVFRLQYSPDDNSWHRIDSSYTGIGDWIGSWDYGGHQYTKFGADPENTEYTIYVSGDNDRNGDPVTRSYYEKQSIDNTAKTLNEVLGILNVSKSTGDSPNVRAAWNTFAYNIRSSNHDFVDLKSNDSLQIDYATQGGTRTDTAMTDALAFNWGNSNTKYAILITDGAPQYSSDKNKNPDYPGGTLESQTNTLISNIKTIKQSYEQQGIKLITVGLSMKDVEKGSQLLYDIADSIDGERMFFAAESGDELESVLLKIIKKIMEECTVYGDVQDTVGEAFYIVDKTTGRPLSAGQCINLDGELTTDTSKPHGVIQPDGKTVKWVDQAFKPEGWKGTIYVKAKEDLIGGNALPTNTGKATFDAKQYATKSKPNDKIDLKTTGATTHFKPHQERETPLVNVNELAIDKNSTEWTVYLGTSVDPKNELQKLYENIKVKEVIKKGQADDTDRDKLPEIGKAEGDNLWYPLEADSITDDREAQGTGEQEYFYLKDLIDKLTGSPDLDWESLINGDVIRISYDVYGIDDNSYITIRLNKDVKDGEPGLTESPHETAVTGDAVEKYSLEVEYSPDYSVLPKGQGGTSTRDFHTGTYGTIYQGHAAGKETRLNEHTINVFERKLQIEKVDESGDKITGDGEAAIFNIYLKSDNGSPVNGLPEGKYELVAENASTNPNDALTEAVLLMPTANTDDTKTNAYVESDKSYQRYYVDQTEYYIVETTPPNGYIKAEQPVKLDFFVSETKTPVVVDDNGDVLLYNWTQTTSEDKTVQIVKVTNKEMPKKGVIHLEKIWKDHKGNVITTDGSAHPETISYDLYRVKHVHEWDTEHPVVDKAPTDTETGISHYNCKHEGCTETQSISVASKGCKFDDNWEVTTPATCTESGIETRHCLNNSDHIETRIIPATGHTWGNMVNGVWEDNAWAVGVDSTCTDIGYHVQICKNCNAERRDYNIQAKGHSWGSWHEHAATCEKDGYKYRECSVCHAEEKGEVIPATGHDWNEGVVTKQPTEDEEGVMTYTCKNDPSHTKTEAIDRIRNTVQINYHLRSMYWGINSFGIEGLEEDGQIEAYKGGKIIVSYYRKYDPKDEGYLYGTYKAINGSPANEMNKIPRGSQQDEGKIQYRLELDVVEGNELTLYLQDPSGNDSTGGHYDFTIYSIPPATTGTQSTSSKLSSNTLTFKSKTLNKKSSRASLKAQANGAGNVIDIDGSSAEVVNSGNTGYSPLDEMIDRVGYKEGETDHHYYIVEKVYSGNLGSDGWTGSYSVDIADEQNNSYKYFFVETDPSDGWETTYEGQEAGLDIDGKTIITNKKKDVPKVSIKIIKKDAVTKALLPEATFTLTQVDENGNNVSDGIVKGPATTAKDGEITFTELVAGRYKLEETERPDGYIAVEGPYYINVTEDGTDTVDDSQTVKYISVSGHEYTVLNEPGASLPNSGGPGTTWIYILGAILLIGCGTVLVARRRVGKAS